MTERHETLAEQMERENPVAMRFARENMLLEARIERAEQMLRGAISAGVEYVSAVAILEALVAPLEPRKRFPNTVTIQGRTLAEDVKLRDDTSS